MKKTLHKRKILYKCAVRLNYHRPFNKTKIYGLDLSKTKEYVFNSLGYRGEEFNLAAKKKIFVFGCSHTFGVGLDWEETWAFKFKEKYAETYNYKLNEINLMNFGVGAASNDFITRSVVSQCNIIKPDLLIVYFTYITRTEYVSKDKVRSVIPTLNPTDYIRDYYAYYTAEIGMINLVKNILLIQYFCQANKIDYIFLVPSYKKLFHGELASNKVCKLLINLVDSRRLCDFHLEAIDLAADKTHYGLKSNELLASKLLKFYKKRYLRNMD